MKKQQAQFQIGNLRFTVGIGDDNGNGVVDVSVVVRIVGLFELPPVVIDLDASLAQKVKDAFDALTHAFPKK